jgi:hypothetical protein
MATPLIRTPLVTGGTFYAFTSAAKDLTKTFNNDDLKFEFSKFALLNLPDVNTPVHKENFVQFNAIDGAIFNELNADDNINLVESLQNYALNIESLILSDDDYDPNVRKTVAERVFFKWLKELGAIRFREATATEKSPTISGKRFVEEDTIDSGTRRYEKVVQYMGNIDVINNVEKNGHTYTEIYINVPTKVGNTPVCLFESLSDANYYASMGLKGQTELIDGRTSTTIHPDGLSLNAFYDYERAVEYTDPDANWPDAGTGAINTYFTEPDTFEDATSTEITKYYADYAAVDSGITPFTDLTYMRSSLDGIGLDYNAGDYYDIATDPNLTNILEYNSNIKSKDFQFNAILVYYDIYNTSTPTDRATNLYGIIFLDNLTPTSTGSYIQRLRKFKPNSITKLNGNSYGLKLNIKFDTSVDNVGIETIINDYSTFSMDLFIDASTQLQEAAKVLLETQSRFLDVIDRVTDLENLVFTNENVTELKARVNGLEANIQNAQLALNDSTTVLDLIANNSDRINKIVNGDTPLELQYNTDVLKSGAGTLLDKSTPNSIKVNNTVQQYKISQLYKEDSSINMVNNSNKLDLNQTIDIPSYAELKEFTNYIIYYTENTALSDVYLYIDDTNTKFKEGQAVRIKWNTEFSIGPKTFYIYTDKQDRLGNGEYGTLVGVVTGPEFKNTNPILEVVCIDEASYIFNVDVVR